MPPFANNPEFNTGFDPKTGQPVQIAPGLMRVTAPNSGPFTFTGTNSFIVGDSPAAIVDPGPDSPAHLKALLQALGGRKVEAILLTHTHKDHSRLAIKLAAATEAPLWFGGPHRLSRPRRVGEVSPVLASCEFGLRPDQVLKDGESVKIAGLRVGIVATPGHCANHLCFGLGGTGVLLSGDHVMGWNTTLVAPPDGSMGDYLASLEKTAGFAARQFVPGHGDVIGDGPRFSRALLDHRKARNLQIVRAVEDGATGIGELVRAIYPKQTLAIWLAARMTVGAHVEYLAEAGKISMRRGPLGLRLSPAGGGRQT